MTHQIPELPQELIETFIDYVRDLQPSPDHGSTPTLKSCTLVCKAWLTRSRRHLFHDIEIKPASEEIKLSLRRITRDKAIETFGHRLEPLLETTNHPSCLPPEVSSLVQRLVISGDSFTALTSAFDNGFFQKLPFTSLQEIELRDYRLGHRLHVDTLSFSELLRKNPMLQSLHLVSLNFHQEHEFLCMLSALHQHVHFRMLDIRSIYMTDQPSSTSQLDEFFASRNDQQRPPLKVVRFRCPEDALTGGLFLRPDSLFDLSKLQELEIMPEEIKSLCFLSHCGSLIRLMLDIRVFIWRGLKIDPFSLSNLNQLEYLEIDGLVFDHDLTEQASFIHTLLPVLPTSLKCLSLRFDVFMPHLMRNFSEHGKKMGVMDEALSSSARKAETETGSTANAMLRNLELRIIYRKKVSLELDVGIIESWFPRLKESGVVTTFERLE